MGQVRNSVISVAVPASVSAGASQDVRGIDMTKAVLQIQTLGTSTQQWQGSIDGATFYNIGSAQTAAGVVNTGGLVTNFVRLNCTAFTSGVGTAAVAGPPLDP
jgi:hypothetical protein